MKKIKFCSSEKLPFYSMCLVAFTLPLSMKINTIAIIFAVLINLVQIFRERKFNVFIPRKTHMLFVGYYFLIIASLIYTQNLGEGIKKLEYNSSFLIMPIVFYKLRDLNKDQLRQILKVFVLSMILTSIFLLITAFIRYVPEKNLDVFFYKSLTSPLEFHPVYYSIYITFSIIILMFGLNYVNVKRYIIIIVFLMSILILLSSKSIITACIVFLGVFLFRQKKAGRMLLFGIILSIFLLIFNHGYLKDRFEEISEIENLSILKENSMTDFGKVNGLTLRLMIIKFSVMESLDDPFSFIFGQGYGDKQFFLDTVYEKHNMARTTNGNKIGYYGYNAHNQYIETFVSAGIIGLIYLFFLILSLIKITKTSKIAFCFYCLFIWSFFFESVITVNKGIVLFVFWSVIFINNEIDEDWYNFDLANGMILKN